MDGYGWCFTCGSDSHREMEHTIWLGIGGRLPQCTHTHTHHECRPRRCPDPRDRPFDREDIDRCIRLPHSHLDSPFGHDPFASWGGGSVAPFDRQRETRSPDWVRLWIGGFSWIMTGTHYHGDPMLTVALTASIAGQTHQRCCAARESDAGVRIAGTA